MSALTGRQRERDDLLTAIGAADAVGQVAFDQQTVRRKALAKIGDWRAKLAKEPRQVLREALTGPIRFTPDGRQYRFKAKTSAGGYIAASTAETAWPPAD